jgi:hypothetical protein
LVGDSTITSLRRAEALLLATCALSCWGIREDPEYV